MKSEPNILGIDHPVIASRDLDRICNAFERLGFKPTPRNYHPWGTANNLIMFSRDFIELLGIEDAARLHQDVVPNSRIYSEFVHDFLAQREGFSLMALHSDDMERDHRQVEGRGLASTGRIEFRRTVVLPDGTEDEAVVSLSMLINSAYPNLSTFICQQHKPHLVWNPAWQRHPNRTDGIRSVSYVADEPDLVVPYYQALYGPERVHRTLSGLEINTPNGVISVLASGMVGSRFPEFEGILPPASERPCGIAMSVHSQDLSAVIDCLTGAGVPFIQSRDVLLRVGPDYTGGIVLEFVGD